MTLSETVAEMLASGGSSADIIEVVRAYEEARLAKQRRDVSDGEWYRLRNEVLERDGHACVYCGARASDRFVLQCDHVKPRSKGGRSEASNLVVACINCNSSKRDRTPEEWRA